MSRLKQDWAEEYHTCRGQSLDKDDWIYLWAGSVYSGLRSHSDKLCTLVVIGVNTRGEKHFLAY